MTVKTMTAKEKIEGKQEITLKNGKTYEMKFDFLAIDKFETLTGKGITEVFNGEMDAEGNMKIKMSDIVKLVYASLDANLTYEEVAREIDPSKFGEYTQLVGNAMGLLMSQFQ